MNQLTRIIQGPEFNIRYIFIVLQNKVKVDLFYFLNNTLHHKII